MLAIKEVSDLPIMVTLTYNEDGRTLFGTPPETAVVVLQSLGVDAIGVNCSTGPAEMIALVEKMAEYSTAFNRLQKRLLQLVGSEEAPERLVMQTETRPASRRCWAMAASTASICNIRSSRPRTAWLSMRKASTS